MGAGGDEFVILSSYGVGVCANGRLKRGYLGVFGVFFIYHSISSSNEKEILFLVSKRKQGLYLRLG